MQRRKIKHEEEKKNPEINYATWNENREKSVHPFPPPRIPSPATFAIILSSALAHSSRLLKLSHLELYNTSCFHGLITCYFIVTPFPFIRLFLGLICGTTKFMTTLISVYCIIVILFHLSNKKYLYQGRWVEVVGVVGGGTGVFKWISSINRYSNVISGSKTIKYYEFYVKILYRKCHFFIV